MRAWEAIRDVGRALPWLASEPQPDPVPADLPAEKRADLFKIHAEALRYRHAVLYAVIDRAGKKLAATLGAAEPGEILDPEGEGCEALEKADACFKTQRDELHQPGYFIVRGDGGRPLGPVRGRGESLADPSVSVGIRTAQRTPHTIGRYAEGRMRGASRSAADERPGPSSHNTLSSASVHPGMSWP